MNRRRGDSRAIRTALSPGEVVGAGGIFVAFDESKRAFESGSLGDEWDGGFGVLPGEREPGIVSLAVASLSGIAGDSILVGTLRFRVVGASPAVVVFIFVEGLQQTEFSDASFVEFYEVVSGDPVAQIVPRAAAAEAIDDRR